MFLALAVLLSSSASIAAPARVVSLDYCADQYLLALADRSQIAAVSQDVDNERSYYAGTAEGIPRISDSAEAIVAENPDLVLRVWGGGYRVDDMMTRFHVPVIAIPFAKNMEELRHSIREVGQALGTPERAEALIARMDDRLGKIRARWRGLPPDRRPVAVYITPGGMSAGTDTLIDIMMEAAGVRNMTAIKRGGGWQSLDLEKLILAAPDAVVLGFDDLAYNATGRWQFGRHAALKAFMDGRPVAKIPSRVIACTAWYFVDGVETIFNSLVAPRLAAAGTDAGQ